MITKFDSLFAGHIDMENAGYAGTPVNDRRFPNEDLAGVFDKAQAMAQLMDRVGYNAFWMAEHHFQHEGYECIPNVLMTALHLAHVTRRLKIGCGFNITPMWHPLRLAEDYATADILTGGRIIFGVGRGYHTREVETFGSPLLDQQANRELFEEQIDIIFRAFNEKSFSHRGKYYTLPPEVPYRGYTLKELTVVPRPLRLPVECWQPIQGGTARAMDFMAKHGIRGLIGGGSAEGGAMHRVVLGWQEAHARRDQHLELGERLCFGFHFYLAKNREQGIREAAKYYEENMKMSGANCASISSAKKPPRRTSSSNVPVSTMRPPRNTRMRLALRMVASRCAMTNVVRPFMTSSSAILSRASVSGSSALVASSRMRIGGSLSSARATAMR